jgi:hypothetical protein
MKVSVYDHKVRKARQCHSTPVPEIIDPVFAKISQNARFLLSENERFELVFVKTGSINSGTGFFANPRERESEEPLMTSFKSCM